MKMKLTLMRLIQFSDSSYANKVPETPEYMQHFSKRLDVP